MAKAVVVPELSRATFEHEGLMALRYAGPDDLLVAVRDDDPRVRWRVKFRRVHAIRVTASGCFDYAAILIESKISRRVVELLSSSWIKTLAAQQREHDSGPATIDGARHFVLAFHAQVVEVAADGAGVEPVPMRLVGGRWVEA